VASELGGVLIGIADLLDDPVQSEPLEQTGDLRSAELLEVVAQRTVAEPVNEELAAAEDLEQGLVVVIEEVEAAIAMVTLFDGLGDL